MVRHNRFLQISLTALVSAFLIFSAASAAGKSKKSKKERVYRVTITNVTKGQIFSPPFSRRTKPASGSSQRAHPQAWSSRSSPRTVRTPPSRCCSKLLPRTSSTWLRTWRRAIRALTSSPAPRRSTRFAREARPTPSVSWECSSSRTTLFSASRGRFLRRVAAV